VNPARAAALIAALAVGAVGCAKVQPASVYLEIANGPGAPRPDQVKIDIYAPGAAGQLGAPLKTFPALAPQANGDLLGTLVIYSGAEVTRLSIRAQGLTGGRVISQGGVDVDIVSKQQVSARITLAAAPGGDAGTDAGVPGDGGGEAGSDGGATGGDGGAPDGAGGRLDADAGAGAVAEADADAHVADTGASSADASPSGDTGSDLAADQVGSPSDGRTDGPLPDAGGPPTIISVDFVGASPTPMAATEQAGVVPAARWSSAAGGVGNLLNLVDGTGVATTASISWNAGAANNIYLSSIPDLAGNNRMMNGYLDPTNGQVATITASNLPSALAEAGYDVYVYSNGSVPAGETRTFNYAIGTTTQTLSETMAQIFSGTFVMAPGTAGGAGNYVVFRGIRGAAFTLTSTPGASTSMFQRSPVNGLQIVGR